MELRVLVADTTDPYFNLATEDWIFRDMSADSKVMPPRSRSELKIFGFFEMD